MDRYWSDPDLSRDPRRMTLTVRMALSHRTGLPNWRDAKGLAFDHDPGTTTSYSGEGYQYAARYAENRTGQSFETLAGRWLFAPAHMRASGYVSAQGAKVSIAVPYDDAGKPLPAERVTRYNAADLAHATARDHARFLIDARKLAVEATERMQALVADKEILAEADLIDELVTASGAVLQAGRDRVGLANEQATRAGLIDTQSSFDEDFGKTGFARDLFRLRLRGLKINQRRFAERFRLAFGNIKDVEQARR